MVILTQPQGHGSQGPEATSPAGVCDKPGPVHPLPAARREHPRSAARRLVGICPPLKTFLGMEGGREGAFPRPISREKRAVPGPAVQLRVPEISPPPPSKGCLPARVTPQPGLPPGQGSLERAVAERSPPRRTPRLTVAADDGGDQRQEKDRAGPGQRRPDVDDAGEVQFPGVHWPHGRRPRLGAGPGPSPHPRRPGPSPLSLGSPSRSRAGPGGALRASGSRAGLTCGARCRPARLRARGRRPRRVGGRRRRGRSRRGRGGGLGCGSNRAWLGAGLGTWTGAPPPPPDPRASALGDASSRRGPENDRLPPAFTVQAPRWPLRAGAGAAVSRAPRRCPPAPPAGTQELAPLPQPLPRAQPCGLGWIPTLRWRVNGGSEDLSAVPRTTRAPGLEPRSAAPRKLASAPTQPHVSLRFLVCEMGTGPNEPPGALRGSEAGASM